MVGVFVQVLAKRSVSKDRSKRCTVVQLSPPSTISPGWPSRPRPILSGIRSGLHAHAPKVAAAVSAVATGATD